MQVPQFVVRDFMRQRERYGVIARAALEQASGDVHEAAGQGKGYDLPNPENVCRERRSTLPDRFEPRHHSSYFCAWPSPDIALGAIFCLQFVPEPLVQGLVRSWTPVTRVGTRLAFGVIGVRHAANVRARATTLNRLGVRILKPVSASPAPRPNA